MEYFSTEFINSMMELKSERFQEQFKRCICEIDNYVETEEEKKHIHSLIEGNMKIAEKGNMIMPHALISSSNFENQEEAINFIVEDVTGMYMFDENVIKATVVIICIHFDGISLSDDFSEAFRALIGINYAEQGVPVPQIIVCINDKGNNLRNGYRIYWMK